MLYIFHKDIFYCNIVTMFFCFFLMFMYLPDCIYSKGIFGNRMRKQWDNGWAVIVISIGNRCFVKEDSYEKVTPVCRVISAKTLRMGVCFISNVTRGSSCSVPFASIQMCMRQRSRRKENLEWNCIIGLCLVSYLVFGL